MQKARKSEAKQDARMQFRVHPLIKDKVVRAAQYSCQTVTEFSQLALLEKAEAVIAQQERIQLSQSAFEEFLKALETPQTPSPKLLAAVERYKSKNR